jgi:SAM-dependent methyltransferase
VRKFSWKGALTIRSRADLASLCFRRPRKLWKLARSHVSKPDKPSTLPFPVPDSHLTLVNALSVFTHLTQDQAPHYLRECARILHPEGLLHASWFLFDKSDFPTLHEINNALYVSYIDPSAAVIFDRKWVRNTAHEMGLTICKIIPPQFRGYQWVLS